MLKKMAGKVQEDEFRGQPNNSVFDQALHKMFWGKLTICLYLLSL